MAKELMCEVNQKIELLAKSFQKVLYEDDTTFMENMKTKNLAGDDICKYQFWEWTQGVGMFGYWKLYSYTGDEQYLKVLTDYYDRQIEIGLPSKNVNTTAPLLAMSYLAEITGNTRYMEICCEWAEWLIRKLPKTKEDGFQHITSDSINEQELWDDTLFMSVLFLANMGRILKKKEYIQEAQYQFMVHIKYLTDKKTGLWYHGWSFKEKSNFSEALWGRGNCWITAAIPLLLEIDDCPEAVSRFFKESLRRQIESLEKLQDSSGMWHTLIDDPTSYCEASATCGFAYGILLACEQGIIEPRFTTCVDQALKAILNCIQDDGVVNQVSYGTPMGRDSKDFYKTIAIKPMPYGQALAILFLLQYKKYMSEKKQ